MNRSQIFLIVLQLLAAGYGGYAQNVSSVTAADVNVNYMTEVVLTCMVDYTGSEPEITIEKVEGSFSTATMNTDGSGTATLTLQSVVYEDMGEYICSAETLNDTLMLTIIEYVPLHVEGVGFGSVSTADQVTVSCPITGNPGPAIIYWQNEDGDNITTAVNRNGPFVNQNEELDLRNAPPDEGSVYTCTAVDVTGASLTQPFVVEVVEEGRSIFTEWYLILVYCVVGVILLVAFVLAIWFIVKIRDSCYAPVKKTVRVKEHVRRSDAFGFHIGRKPNLAYRMQENSIEEVPEP